MKTLALLCLMATAMRLPAAETASAPATVHKEGDLVILTLKPEAEQRLRLKVVPVERRGHPGDTIVPGEVVLPLAAEGKSRRAGARRHAG